MRVVIAEDSVLLREGLARLLGDAGFEVVAQCGDADDLLLKVRSYAPDVAIVDIRLPPTHNDEGLRAALEIRAQPPVGRRARALPVRRARAGDEAARRLGRGRRLPAEGPDQRRRRVRRRGAAGRRRAARRSTRSSSRRCSRKRRSDDPLAELTPREREVLELMADGQLEPGDRRQARDHAARGREVRLEHLRQARPALDRQRVAARARVLAFLRS